MDKHNRTGQSTVSTAKLESLRQDVKALEYRGNNIPFDPHELASHYNILDESEIDFDDGVLDKLLDEWEKRTATRDWTDQQRQLAKGAFVAYCQQFDLIDKIRAKLKQDMKALPNEGFASQHESAISQQMVVEYGLAADLQSLMSSLVSRNTFETIKLMGVDEKDAMDWMREMVKDTLMSYKEAKQIDMSELPVISPPGKGMSDEELIPQIDKMPEAVGNHVICVLREWGDAALLEPRTRESGRG